MGEERELTLIQHALRGELEAWGEMITRYKQAVFGICLGILGNSADAEDATQEAFIRAYERLHTYDLRRKFSTWLFTVAANLCKNQLRRARFLVPLKHPGRLLGGEDPAQIVAQDQRREAVRQALSRLSFKYRAPLVLRFYADMDYKEIAQVLDLPEGTVKTRIHRAKGELKRLLEEKGVSEYGRETT